MPVYWYAMFWFILKCESNYMQFICTTELNKRTWELYFSSQWLLMQSGAKPQDVASCFSLGSPSCFLSPLFLHENLNRTFSKVQFKRSRYLLSMQIMSFFVFDTFYQVQMPFSDVTMQQLISRRTWRKTLSLRAILDSGTKPKTPFPPPTLPVFFESADVSERLWYEKLNCCSVLAGRYIMVDLDELLQSLWNMKGLFLKELYLR